MFSINMRIIIKSVAIACLSLLIQFGISPLPASADTCVAVTQTIKQGKTFHGANCNSVDGCKCTGKKCRVTLTLPGTGYKTEEIKYKDAKCENTVKLDNKVPAGCRPFEASINNGQTFHTVKCKDSGGCFCSGLNCGGQVKQAKCWKAPT